MIFNDSNYVIIFLNYAFANEVTDDYLKNLAKEMITPTIWDFSNPDFREDTRKKDLEILKKVSALSKDDKQKLAKFMNWDKVRYQIHSSDLCLYESFPKTIIIKNPVTAWITHIYYWTLTTVVTNDKNWEWSCDNKIWFPTSKPYIWGTTWRARAYL